MSRNGIRQITSPPYHPSSNGAAENSVKTIKIALKKKLYRNISTETETILCRFLLDYRNTPHSTTGVTPAKPMFGRNLRNRFDLLLANSEIKDENFDRRVDREQANQRLIYVGNKGVSFNIGDEFDVKQG